MNIGCNLYIYIYIYKYIYSLQPCCEDIVMSVYAGCMNFK